MARLLPVDALQLLERLASADCDVEATLAPRSEGSDDSAEATTQLAMGLAAMPYPLLAAEAASVRVYCACLVRAGPDRVPRLLGCLRARAAELATLDGVSSGGVNIPDVLGLATLTRCVVEQLVREPPRTVAEWDALLSLPGEAAAPEGAGLSCAVDSLLEFVARCSVGVNDARYYVLAEVVCSLVLLATVRTSPMPGRLVFGQAFLRSAHASEASRKLLGHVVSREAGSAPAPPSTLYRKIGSLTTALFSVPSSLFAMVGIGATPGSALAGSDANSDPAPAAMAAAAEAAAIAAAHVEADRDAYCVIDDGSSALPSQFSADVLAERALALLLLLSQFDEHQLAAVPELEPEPELGSSISNPYLDGLGGSSDLESTLSHGNVFSRVGAWLADPRGTAWAYVLVTNPLLSGFKNFLLERTDVDIWLLPLLQQLYMLSGPRSQPLSSNERSGASSLRAGGAGIGSAGLSGGERHRIAGTELVLVILLELLSGDSDSSDSDERNSWCGPVQAVVLGGNSSTSGGGRQIPSWFSAEQIKQQLTIGSMLVIVLCRVIIRNLQLVVPSRSGSVGGGFARAHGQFVLRSALALLENIAPHLRDLHAIAADRLVRTYLGVVKRLTARVTARTEACPQGEEQQHEEEKQTEELLWMVAGLFDGLLVNDDAIRCNAELMYALLRSKNAIDSQLAATRVSAAWDHQGMDVPVVAAKELPIATAEAADAAAMVTATATTTAGSQPECFAAKVRVLDNLQKALQVFDDAASQATAGAAAIAAATALGGATISPALPESDTTVVAAPAGAPRRSGDGVDAAGTVESSSAMSTVKDLMESCVAETAATWQGADHHGLRLPSAGASNRPGTVTPWRFKQNPACAAAFLTPYVWQLVRRLTREPTGPGGTTSGGATSRLARLSNISRPAWASIPDSA